MNIIDNLGNQGKLQVVHILPIKKQMQKFLHIAPLTSISLLSCRPLSINEDDMSFLDCLCQWTAVEDAVRGSDDIGSKAVSPAAGTQRVCHLWKYRVSYKLPVRSEGPNSRQPKRSYFHLSLSNSPALLRVPEIPVKPLGLLEFCV